MKKRAFDEEESVPTQEAPAPERTEPTPRGRTAIALITLSWVMPLGVIVSLLSYSEFDSATLHRTLTLLSIGLLLTGLGLAIRAIDLARKNPRLRRRLAYAALLLGILTPLVWTSELAFAYEMFVMREHLDAAADADDATSPSAE